MVVWKDVTNGDAVLSDAHEIRKYGTGEAVRLDGPVKGLPAVVYVDTELLTVGGEDTGHEGDAGRYQGADGNFTRYPWVPDGTDEGEGELTQEAPDMMLGDDGSGSGPEQQPDLVEALGLQEVGLTKGSFRTAFKNYLKKVKVAVAGDKERAEHLMKDAQALTDFMNDVLARFDEFRFFTGASGAAEGCVIPAEHVGSSPAPRLYYAPDALELAAAEEAALEGAASEEPFGELGW